MLSSTARAVAIAGATAMTLAACGGGSAGTDSGADPLPPATTEVAVEAPTAAEPIAPPPTEATDVDAPTTSEVDDQPSALAVHQAEDVADTPGPVATEPLPPAATPAEIGGRTFAEALGPASNLETNVLPDLIVDDVRRQSKVNLRNVFPADRPVLIWMWAPH